MNDERKTIIEEKYVRTEVKNESGRWVVYLEVGDTESSVEHRIQEYSSKRKAEIAAGLIKRAAEREDNFKNFRLD